jgi:hypothetical protein
MRRGGRGGAARLALVGALAACVSAAAAAPAAAALLYTVVVTPLTANQYSATDFSVTASNLNLLDDLGCLQLDLPASFTIVSLSQPDASSGEDWLISRSGQSVVVQSDDGGGRLELGESVTFTVRAKPLQAGVFDWEHHAHRDQDCDSGDLLGAPATVTVLAALLPTPLPTIGPTPTLAPLPSILPTPTLAPLPTVLPTPSPTPRPTLAPSPSPTRAAPSAQPTPAPPAETDASPSGSPPPVRAGAPAAGSSDPTPANPPDSDRTEAVPVARDGGPGSGGGLDLRRPREVRLVEPAALHEGLDVGPFSLLIAAGAWYIPAAVIGGPGLLVILFVALQLAGAAAWIPAVRRLRGERPGAR